MKLSRPPRSLLVLFVSLAAGGAFAWDPEDATFDPTVETVIADGKTRLGDPAPFFQVGVEHRGFTHVRYQPAEDGPGTIVVSLLVDMVPGDPEMKGAGLFLRPDDAENLAVSLKQGAEEAESGTGEVDLGPVAKGPMGDDWKARVTSADGTSLVELERTQAGEVTLFRFSPNAARKLAGALTHALGQAGGDGPE